MKSYCLGFAFTDYDNFVVLIRKTKPAWQRGLLNGVGGLVEGEETPMDAMAREFREETGIQTRRTDWTQFTQMRFDDCIVYCFAMRLPRENSSVVSMTEEQVGFFSIIDVRNHPKIIPNLRWLVPMALEVLNNEKHNVPPILTH